MTPGRKKPSVFKLYFQTDERFAFSKAVLAGELASVGKLRCSGAEAAGRDGAGAANYYALSGYFCQFALFHFPGEFGR
jgi:hypothetical protein